MYDLINAHVQAILQTIPPDHATDYDWLIQNLHQTATSEYQERYRKYWQLNAARLCANYCAAYFQALQAAQASPPILGDVAQRLYQTPTNKNGRKSLQFSFVTKLLHMVNRSAPIYDSRVAAFYFFQVPSPKQPLQARIASFVAFQNFLGREYRRILTNGLLAQSIQAFRKLFNPQQFTDEKLIDSLLWAYVALLRNGGLTNGAIIYR